MRKMKAVGPVSDCGRAGQEARAEMRRDRMFNQSRKIFQSKCKSRWFRGANVGAVIRMTPWSR